MTFTLLIAFPYFCIITIGLLQYALVVNKINATLNNTILV